MWIPVSLKESQLQICSLADPLVTGSTKRLRTLAARCMTQVMLIKTRFLLKPWQLILHLQNVQTYKGAWQCRWHPPSNTRVTKPYLKGFHQLKSKFLLFFFFLKKRETIHSFMTTQSHSYAAPQGMGLDMKQVRAALLFFSPDFCQQSPSLLWERCSP